MTCSHCIAGRVDVLTGNTSTMERVKDIEDFFMERCKICGFERTTTKSTQYNKIKRNDAQGIRDQNMSQHWKDALQPVGPDGRENKLFTKEYGWNPHSQDPRVPKELMNPNYNR